jgi:hypothetical protein
MEPYYQHAGLTIYHLIFNCVVINCDSWITTKELGDIGLENAERIFPNSNLDRRRDINRHGNTSKSARDLAPNTMRGKVAMHLKKQAGLEPRVYTQKFPPAKYAEKGERTAITSMETQKTTDQKMSFSCAGDATCWQTVD